MTDSVNPEVRSRIMASIKQKDTAPELAVRRHLHALGFRYRLHVRSLPGSPDLVLKGYKSVIFVHGCFWHQHHGCKRSRVPDTHRDYWKKKLWRNVKRDRRAVELLRKKGWRVFIVWECQITPKALDALAESIRSRNPE